MKRLKADGGFGTAQPVAARQHATVIVAASLLHIKIFSFCKETTQLYYQRRMAHSFLAQGFRVPLSVIYCTENGFSNKYFHSKE